MATLREYFNTLCKHTLRVGSVHTLKVDETDFAVNCQVLIDFEMAAECVSYYVPQTSAFVPVCKALIDATPQSAFSYKESIRIESWHPTEERTKIADLVFTRRVFIYAENDSSNEQEDELRAYAREKGMKLTIRGQRFVTDMSAMDKPIAFISHDSRDKEEIAGKIALELERKMCHVWYDKFSLNIGDDLRTSIEKGLRECRKVIVILSPNFLSNRGWTKTEFESVFAREMVEGQSVLLPVWVNVTREQVYEYCPRLANVFAANWSDGLEAVVGKLLLAVNANP